MKYSLVLSTQITRFEAATLTGDLEANIARIAGWGYEGVELAIRDPSLVDIETLAAVIDNHGLRVPAIGTGQAWGEEGLSFTSDDPAIRHSAIARIKSHIPLAKRLNAVIVIGLIRGITPAGQPHAQSMAYLVDALKECAGKAALCGVRFALEPLNRYETDLIHTVRQGLDLIERVDLPNFGLLLDTFHMNIEEPDMLESIRACGSKLFHFHVADSNRRYPGAGHLDFETLLRVLKAAGYDGFVSGEFMPLPDAVTAAEQCIRFLRQIDPDRRRG